MNSLKPKLVLIGSSTGGPGLLEQIVTSFDIKLDGSIIIAQHMDTFSLDSFARRLNRINKVIDVVFCNDSQVTIDTNTIYLLNDTAMLVEVASLLQLQRVENFDGIYHPTIDELFFSASALNKYEIRAYILSGIGSDGAKGLKALKERGNYCVAQDEQTSIVYGMPKSAKEIEATSTILSIDEIIKDINVFLA